VIWLLIGRRGALGERALYGREVTASSKKEDANERIEGQQIASKDAGNTRERLSEINCHEM
jgi:hypothetical protein